MMDYVKMFIVVLSFGVVMNLFLAMLWVSLFNGFPQKGNIFVNYKNQVMKTKKFIIINVVWLVILVLSQSSVYITHSGINKLNKGLEAIQTEEQTTK